MNAQFKSAAADLPLKWRIPFEQDWCAIPVPLRTKVPVISWKSYQTERPTLETITRWAATESNVAIVTGAISGLMVLDLDSAEAVAEAERRGLPDTVMVRTSKGRHVYFEHPGGKVGNRAGLLPGVDIRGDGGFVVAPGSVHPTGAAYEWIRAPGRHDLAPIPEWLAELLSKPAERVNIASSATRTAPRAGDGADTPYGLAALVDECAAIRSAGSGTQETTLNSAALKCGGLVAGKELQHTTARSKLIAAALDMQSHKAGQWVMAKIVAKVDRALSDGAASPRAAPERCRAVKLSDFFAYMPAHNYIFAPSGEFWPAASVNSQFAPIPLKDDCGNVVVDDNGKVKTQQANQWLDQRRAVQQMTWAPGEPQVVPDRLISDGGWIIRPHCSVFNLYRPPIIKTGNPGEARPWIDHVKRVYPDDHHHLIHWLAHRVQRPEEKINHAIVLGGAQGIGKDTILEPVKTAIGPWNFTEVSPQHMLGRFNGFVKSVILRVSEARDLGDVDRFAFYDHMKTYTAAPPDVLRVDEKHVREYAVFNVCGVIITTNHKTDGIFLPADDRRHYVAWSECTRDSFDDGYWSKLYGWYAAGGLDHVAEYLRTLPLSGFDAKAPPPKTAAFWDIVSSNQSPEDAELADALDFLGRPNVVTVDLVKEASCDTFREFLTERRNSRRIPHRFEECGYVAVRNRHATDGLFKIGTRRAVIYAKKSLPLRDQISAAETLTNR